MLDEADVRSFLDLRRRTRALFPGIFMAIRERVVAELSGSGAVGVVGEFDRERAMSLFPELGDDVPLDWVAFGFPGHDFYDLHVGVILETQQWPVLCHTGLHVSDGAWSELESHVRGIDWIGSVGHDARETVAGAVREHRFCDAPELFEFEDASGQVELLARRAVAYYRAALPVVKP
jgi:hypothetical protein